ncbi:hypothetical protein K788_00003590 [Paraburkholderia caribensis MBA4]|uniref:Uncharacterized protein n=1 Tax=Paraburkholderia caribensis MBA4 TaxID=1323664 RepID=A0A0N7JV54_9BURK|nr:hypothetical protein K788_00003590 [Paraburkholderia caribensis MBA4]
MNLLVTRHAIEQKRKGRETVSRSRTRTRLFQQERQWQPRTTIPKLAHLALIGWDVQDHRRLALLYLSYVSRQTPILSKVDSAGNATEDMCNEEMPAY